MGEVQINNRVAEVENLLNGMSAVVFSQVYKRVSMIQIIRIEQICGCDLQILLNILTFGDLVVNVTEKSVIFSFYMQF